MYRIIFNPRRAAWQLQLRTHLIWRTVQTEASDVLEFADFEAAQGYVLRVGLQKVYRDWHAAPSMWHVPATT